jgi:hypothetical protein
MRTPSQIKEQLQWDEFDRCRRIIDDLESAIKRNFQSGILDMSVVRLDFGKDRDWIIKDLEKAGYTISEEVIQATPHHTYHKTYIKWTVPNE